MIVPIILLSLGAISLSWFLFEKLKGYCLKEVIIKGITSAFFIALGIYALYTTNLKHFSKFAVLGLVCGLFGDIFLELKYAYRSKEYEYTMAGFIAFAIGHILYITGMFLEFYKDQSVLFILVPIFIGLLMGPGTIFMGKLLKTNYGRYKVISFIYATILFTMLASTFSVWMMSGFINPGLLLLFIAGILFTVSDLILNLTYFGEGHDKPFDLISNAITYYSAQFIIAFSIIFI